LELESTVEELDDDESGSVGCAAACSARIDSRRDGSMTEKRARSSRLRAPVPLLVEETHTAKTGGDGARLASRREGSLA